MTAADDTRLPAVMDSTAPIDLPSDGARADGARADSARADGAAASPPRRRVGFNISVLAGGQAVTWSVTLAWTFVVPRLLGPSGMGRLTTAYAAAAILGVLLALGTKTFLVREIVARPEDAGTLLGSALALRVCTVPLFAVAVVAYGRLAHFDSQTLAVLYVITGATLFTLFAEPFQAGWQGVERMEYLAYSDVLDKTAQSFIGIASVLLGFGALAVGSAALAIEGLIVLLNAWWMRRYIRIVRRPSLHQMRQMVRQSLPYWSFGLFFMIYLWVDAAMLSVMAPAAVVGWYGVSTKLFTTLMFVPVILATAWLPRLVAAFDGDPADGSRALNTLARGPVELTLGVALPICVVTALTAAPVIRLLYGPAYARAVPVMVILAFCLPPMYLNTMLNQVVVAARRQHVWTWVMLGATIVNPAFNFVLIRAAQTRFHNGAIGAAASLLLTELLIVGVGFILVGRHVLGLSSLWRLARVSLSAAAMGGIMFAARPLGFVFATMAGVTVFLGLLILFRVPSTSEKEGVRSAVARAHRSVTRRNPLRRMSA